MKVKELKEKLEGIDEDGEVYIKTHKRISTKFGGSRIASDIGTVTDVETNEEKSSVRLHASVEKFN
jgi:hypothetical protein